MTTTTENCNEALYVDGHLVGLCGAPRYTEHDHSGSLTLSAETVYAYPGYDTRDDGPAVADRWMYQHGDKWMAVADWESEDDWFADCDEDRTWTPRRRVLPITERPAFGTLTYVTKDAHGDVVLHENESIEVSTPHWVTVTLTVEQVRAVLQAMNPSVTDLLLLLGASGAESDPLLQAEHLLDGALLAAGL